jgi:trk system potassium uptake protein TrkA
MYIIITGCGRIGSDLADRLSGEGNDVVIIDRDSGNFSRLGSGTNCMTVTGMPIDEDILKEAGIEKADALLAVTDDDNTNIMTTQIAQHLYHVPFVIARTADPEKQRALTKMNLKTVCSATLMVESMLSALKKGGTDS